jgi:hypothetical protein
LSLFIQSAEKIGRPSEGAAEGVCVVGGIPPCSCKKERPAPPPALSGAEASKKVFFTFPDLRAPDFFF